MAYFRAISRSAVTPTPVTNECIIANWDFKQSLIDTIGNREVSLTDGTRDSSGVHLTQSTSKIVLPDLYMSSNLYIEAKFGTITGDLTNNKNKGIITYKPSNSSSPYGLILRRVNYAYRWQIYNGTWADNILSENENYFSNSTLKYEVNSDGIPNVYKDGTLVLTGSQFRSSLYPKYLQEITIGGCVNNTNNESLYNITIESLKIGYYNGYPEVNNS